MKLVDLQCPHCGAQLQLNVGQKEAYCQYCGQKLLVDDEVQHIQYDNVEQAGYEFEKGRQRAQAEQRAQQRRQTTPPYNPQAAQKMKKSRGAVGTCWMIFLWLCFFPIMLTIWIFKTDRIKDKRVKYGLIAAVWIICIPLSIANKNDERDSSTQQEVTADADAEDATTESMDDAVTESVTEASTEAAIEDSKTTGAEEVVSDDAAEQEKVDSFVATLTEVLDASFGKDNYEVLAAAPNGISICIWNSDYEGISDAALNGDSSALERWDSIRAKCDESQSVLYQAFKGYGFADEDASLITLYATDSTQENIVLGYLNDTCSWDVVVANQ